MFNKLFFLILFLCTSVNAMEQKIHKKLIIHLDVNGTLVFGDTSGGRTVEDSAKLALADIFKDRWDSSLAQPISYYTYARYHMHAGPSSDQALRAKWTQASLNFLTFLEENKHPQFDAAQELYKQMVAKLKAQKGTVFNSFYKLIEYLEACNCDYSIMLRTFGSDLDRVIPEVHETLGYEFFKVRGRFKETNLSCTLPDNSEQQLTTYTDIYNLLKNGQHAGIRDDYPHWSAHNEHQEYGKMFPIDTNDEQTVSVFCDDNVQSDPTSSRNIVNPVDVKTGQPIKVSDLIASKKIVVVNGVQALLDDEYFIKLVEAALQSK